MPRLLFFSDTHLGFDLPQRPRIERRRRGHDFFTNFKTVLAAARKLRVDGVVHGGDLFFRSKVPAALVEDVFDPLLELAGHGMPIYLVPGNHERSVIPSTLFTQHSNIHTFSRPRTFVLSADSLRIGLSGFPFIRHDVRSAFKESLESTRWRSVRADAKLLCLHQTVQGATVGQHNYQFRHGPDIIPMHMIPSGFAAVLAGHIHRHQILTSDGPHGPVIYSGSTERTSFAEKDEPKGYVILDLSKSAEGGELKTTWRFHPLKTRQMVTLDLQTDGCSRQQILRVVKDRLAKLPQDGIVHLNLMRHGGASPLLSLAEIRAIAPSSMNVTVRYHGPAGGASNS